MESDWHLAQRGDVIMSRLAFVLVATLLTGCGLAAPCGNGDPFALFQYCEKRVSYPYGAHWVKEGMTQESRRSDFNQCGGDVNLREGYAEWLSSVPYETYSAGKTQHIRAIATCMRSKNYVWQDSCDTRCLFP